jgi:hypothetical protein
MAIPRSVKARLVERLIFNFRLRPEAFAPHLPVPWLKPQVVNGWSVVSFCILNLEKVIVSPLPGIFGYTTTSCAYRCGVIDTSGSKPEPSVYITDRQTDLPLIARLAPWIFLDTILMVRPDISDGSGEREVTVRYLDRQYMFKGTIKPAASFKSEVFPSIGEFGTFIKGGVSSYTPSVYGDRLTRVDLVKDEPAYEPLDASVEYDWLDGAWSDADLKLDSAVRAGGGGRYKWTYRGLVPYELA